MSEVKGYSLENTLYAQIPIPKAGSLEGWKEKPIIPINEPLVPLGVFTPYRRIHTNPIYSGIEVNSPYRESPVEGGLVSQFVRQTVADRLMDAQKELPFSYYFVVFDAYRTLEAQNSLFNYFYNQLADKYPDRGRDWLLEESQKFVSLPSKDAEKPSPHNTGGAVDLGIIKLPEAAAARAEELIERIPRLGLHEYEEVYRNEMELLRIFKNGSQLEFGTTFDYADKEAALDYFETLGRPLARREEGAKANRRVLYHILKMHGFEPYVHEWWHFNFNKTQMGATTAGLDYAEYGPISLSKTNMDYEQMRRAHHTGSVYLHEQQVAGRILFSSKAVLGGVLIAGDLRQTALPMAVVISP